MNVELVNNERKGKSQKVASPGRLMFGLAIHGQVCANTSESIPFILFNARHLTLL
ncbi:hypothetical protein LX73_0648 [Fodinibius salinus]|uniref:Uncharacterized protein n=1 Tax=Fodinibius salinus TaxID=860790 RepID=A0A5D3YQ10_9BACT|nr:hypothetical protein LX73_0648 [Fodinibius salinus]